MEKLVYCYCIISVGSLLDWDRVDEDSLCSVIIWAFCHEVIDRSVDLIYVICWSRLFSDEKGMGWMGVFYSDPSDYYLISSTQIDGIFYFSIVGFMVWSSFEIGIIVQYSCHASAVFRTILLSGILRYKGFVCDLVRFFIIGYSNMGGNTK